MSGREPRAEVNGLAPGADALAALRSQIHQVHRLLDERVTAAAERTRSAPEAQAEVLSLYVHALCVEDITVNLLLRQTPPVFKEVWIGGHLLPWDLATLQGYAEVVYAATDALLCRLRPTDLHASIDLSDAGLGCPDVSWVLNRFVLWEMAMICGEMAAWPVAARQVVAGVNGRSNGMRSRQKTPAQRPPRESVPSSRPRSGDLHVSSDSLLSLRQAPD